MTNIRLIALALVAALLVLAGRARAQSPDEQSAYVALSYTPVAGLPPLPPRTDTLDGRASGLVLQGRLGHMTRRGGLTLTTVGLGVELPVRRWAVGGTLAYMSASCGPAWAGDNDCAGDIMVGGSARTLLMARPLSSNAVPAKGKRGARNANEGMLLVGFDASVGFSPRQGEQAVALAAGLPTALAIEGADVRILPFLTPGIGYGRLGNVQFEEDEFPTSHGTMILMIGGGIGLQFKKSGIGATLGFQRVLKSEGGATQLGLNMTWPGLTLGR